MSINERSEILAGLYRAQADLGVICQRANDIRALSVYSKAAAARDSVNEAIAEFRPDSPAPSEIQFPRSKYEN